MQLQYRVVFPFKIIFSFFKSIPIMKVLFLCSTYAWFRAAPNSRVSTKFPTCVIDNLCVWKNGQKIAPY